MPVHRGSAATAWQAVALASGQGDKPDLDVARRVIRAEIDGLKALAEALDGTFESAVAAFTAVRGRVIVTGVGKSGHVGRKIAATLASTGTPAQFIHPVEASHGDLGMIGAGDAILALSNSGETSELADIVAYSRRRGLPNGTGADDLDDDDDDPRRLPCDRASRTQRLLSS
jgi:arabinose-5-phosphate isomerase